MSAYTAIIFSLSIFLTAYTSDHIDLDAFNVYMIQRIQLANKLNHIPHFPPVNKCHHGTFDTTALMQTLHQDKKVSVTCNNITQMIHTRDLTEHIFALFMQNTQYSYHIKVDMNNSVWMDFYFPDDLRNVAQAMEKYSQ